MADDFTEFANRYVSNLKNTLDNLPITEISNLFLMVIDTCKRGATVHFIGNGGSAATPSHSAGDWSKELGLKTIAHSCLLYTSDAADE